jgi:hypothetical protein
MMLSFVSQHIERKENLAHLAPKGSLAQKATPDLGISTMRRSGGADQIILEIVLLCGSSSVRHLFNSLSGKIPGGPSPNRTTASVMVLCLSSPFSFDLTHDFALDLQQTSFHGCGTA